MVLLQNHFFNYLGIVAASNRPGDVEAYFGTNFFKKLMILDRSKLEQGINNKILRAEKSDEICFYEINNSVINQKMQF